MCLTLNCKEFLTRFIYIHILKFKLSKKNPYILLIDISALKLAALSLDCSGFINKQPTSYLDGNLHQSCTARSTKACIIMGKLFPAGHLITLLSENLSIIHNSAFML